MHELWVARARFFSVLIWWISVRYFTIGLEYIFRLTDSAYHWRLFAWVSPVNIGVFLSVFGAIGIAAQVYLWFTCRVNMALTKLFAFGVCMHSIFRITVLLETHTPGDPLMILFLCDFLGMFFLLTGLPCKSTRCS